MNRREFFRNVVFAAVGLAMCPERLLAAPVTFRDVEVWDLADCVWSPVDFSEMKFGQWFRFVDDPDRVMRITAEPIPCEPEGNFIVGTELVNHVFTPIDIEEL